MERVVLIGNCQIEVLAALYRRFAAKSQAQGLTYIPDQDAFSPLSRDAIASADILVEQVHDAALKLGPSDLTAKRIGVPLVSCGFLWPFAGQPHPHNPHPPFLPEGPYGPEFGDAYLNRLIQRGMSPEGAAEDYANANIPMIVNLDRLYKALMDKQAAREAGTGFAIAETIAAHFREEQLFLTPTRPGSRITLALATRFFELMDVEKSDIDHMQYALRTPPFGKSELPVHPAVARHFNLKWAPPERAYRFLDEGGYTFRQFALRYVQCAWNAPLGEGISLSAAGEHGRAVDMLKAGLQASPQSAAGFGALAHSLAKLDRVEEAHAASVQAVVRDLYDGASRLRFGQLLERRGDLPSAERELRIAAAMEPFDPAYARALADFLNRQGRHAEAAAIAAHGLVNAPGAPELLIQLAHAQDGEGRAEEAEHNYRRAATAMSDDPRPLLALADSKVHQGKPGEAVDLLGEALPRETGPGPIRARLVEVLRDGGRGEEADVIAAGGRYRNIDRMPVAELAGYFESLGGGSRKDDAWGFGCEFGFFQRWANIEPLGLLRWASIGPEELIGALKARFEGVHLPDTLELIEHNDFDWGVMQKTYSLRLDHSHLDRALVKRDEALARISKTLKLLRRKFLESLAAGDKILVYRVFDHVLSASTLDRLVTAIGKFGPDNMLLYVTHATEDNAAFTVETISPNLMIGYIDRFAPVNEEIDYNHEGWEAVCRAALKAKRPKSFFWD